MNDLIRVITIIGFQRSRIYKEKKELKNENENRVVYYHLNIDEVNKDLKSLIESRKQILNVIFILNESSYKRNNTVVQDLFQKSNKILFLSVT